MGILKMSLLATVLILVIVIIRALALHKLPKKTFLVLWGVALCRLLIPFSISSRFSVYTVVNMLKHKYPGTDAPYIVTAVPDIGTTADRINTTLADTVTITVSPIMTIWIMGLLACALFFLVTHLRCRREYKTALPIDNEFVKCWIRKHQIWRNVQIRQSDKIAAPLTYGIFQPVILLPKKTDWTNEIRLGYILTHEFVHIRRFDTLTKLLLVSALCVHWVNPFVWVMYVLANRDIELSCDETVVQTFGETMKSVYAMTLIGLEEKKSRLTPLCNNFSKNSLEERIVSIMKMKQTSLVGILFALALVIATTTVFATNAASAVAKEPECAFESSIVLSSEEIAKQEQKRKEETSKKYAVYSKYGLTYNQEKDRFFYNGQLVRFFADKLDENGYYNSFSYTDGAVDLRGVRNAKYALVGIEPVSQEEYDQRTAKIQASSKNLFEAIQENADDGLNNTACVAVEADELSIDISYAIQEGDSLNNGSATREVGAPNYENNSLSAYTKQGVYFDKEKKVWMYKDRPIHLFYDEEYKTFVDNNSLALKDGLSLKVVRNTNGGIEKLSEMTEMEVNALFN